MKISFMSKAVYATKEIWSESKNPKHSDSKFSKPPRHHTSGELSSKRLVHVYGEESDWCEEMLGLENGTSLILSLLFCSQVHTPHHCFLCYIYDSTQRPFTLPYYFLEQFETPFNSFFDQLQDSNSQQLFPAF